MFVMVTPHLESPRLQVITFGFVLSFEHRRETMERYVNPIGPVIELVLQFIEGLLSDIRIQ
jgi:hypothetical protein